MSHLSVDNGLSWHQDTVTLGGPLIHDTEIDKDTFDINFSGTGNFTIENGNVGIGMTNPRHPLQLSGPSTQSQFQLFSSDFSTSPLLDTTVMHASINMLTTLTEPNIQFNYYKPINHQGPGKYWRPTKPHVALMYIQPSQQRFYIAGKGNLTMGEDFFFQNEDHIFSLDLVNKNANIGFCGTFTPNTVLKLRTTQANEPKITFSTNGIYHNGISVSTSQVMYETRNNTTDHVFYSNSINGSGRSLMRIKANYNIIFNDTGTVRLPRLINVQSGHIPTSGEIYYDSTSNKINLYSLNSWKKIPIIYQYTPTSSNDTNGKEGDVSYDTNYLYIKTDKWRRVELEEF